jgi:hypothetical protein
MAYVTYLKRGEALKIGDSVMILESARGAKIVLEVDDETVIHKLSSEELKNARYRKAPTLSQPKEKDKKT